MLSFHGTPRDPRSLARAYRRRRRDTVPDELSSLGQYPGVSIWCIYIKSRAEVDNLKISKTTESYRTAA